MKLPGKLDLDFTVIGENVHTTRVVLRKGKRVAGAGDEEAVFYTTAHLKPIVRWQIN